MARIAWMLLLWLNVVSMATGRPLRADLNGDCRVDMQDLMILLSEWMMEDEDCLMGLGPELVTNGGFDTDSDWTIDPDTGMLFITDGKLVYSGTGDADARQEIDIETGKMYRVVFETSGYVGFEETFVSIGGTTHSFIGNGTVEIDLEAGNSHSDIVFLYLTNPPQAAGCNIDNVSVREVLSDAGGEDSNQSQILLGL